MDSSIPVPDAPASSSSGESLRKEPESESSSQMAVPYSSEFYAPYFSALSKTWFAGPIRRLMLLEDTPGLLSILAGKPNTSTFPITSFSMDVKSPVPPFTPTTIKLQNDELDEALQYGPSRGHHKLIDLLTDLQVNLHARKKDPSWRISIGAGGSDIVYKIILTLTDPGDVVLVEGPTWPGVFPVLVSTRADLVEVPVDGDGIKSASLREILENWPEGKKLPKYLYTVPYGCNPSGATATLERRKEVLALARKYKFLILEDDPYYFLYYGDGKPPDTYFSLEAQDGKGTGLVIRFDSLSKVVAAGLRVAFVTGPAPILDKIDMLTAGSNMQPSSLSQSVVIALLKHWGIEGFKSHCLTVSQFYKERRDSFLISLKKHLGGLVEYTPPIAGMFLWFKLDIPPPADDPQSSEGDSFDLISTKAFDRGVLALPGTSCFPLGRRSAHVRAAFSLLNDEDTDEALRRLAEVVREVRESRG